MSEAAPILTVTRGRSSVWSWLASEIGLAVTALGLVALHVVDDSFLQPEPGTSPADHLAGGLIPVAVLGAAAFAYPRVRAGARASLALFFGLLALVIGAASAGYYTLTVGPSGDDFTGLLAIAAGLTLVGLGIRTLWRSRRLDDSRPRRYLRRSLLGVAAVLALLGLVMPMSLGYFATHVLRPTVPEPNLGAAHENVTFTTSDGLRLHGWYVPSRNGAAVIAFPGRSGPQKHTRMLAANGYGVLLFDRRGEGESDGDPNLFGWGGYRDILAAVDFLESRPDVEPGRIGGLGLSVGGEMMLETAARSDALDAVVSEGAGTRAFGEAMEEVEGTEKLISMPGFLVQYASVAVFSSTKPPPSSPT